LKYKTFNNDRKGKINKGIKGGAYVLDFINDDVEMDLIKEFIVY